MYGCSRVLLKLWQCLLIAPVVRNRGGGGGRGDEYTFNAVWYTFNLSVLCACLVCGLAAVSDDLQAAKGGRSLRMQNTSSAVVTVLQISLEFITCAMAVISSAARHRTLLAIERQLKRVDAALATCPGQPVARYSLALITVHVVLCVVDGRMWYALSSISWLYGVSYVYLSIDLAAMLMYAQIAWNIGRRFEDINAEVEVKLLGFKHNMTAAHRGHRMPLRVRKFARNTIFVSTVISTPGPADSHDMNMKNISISNLQELHWSLCNSIKMVNDTFGWQLFLQLFCNCVQLIVTPYFMIMDLFYPVIYGSTDIKFIMLQVIWVLTHLSHLLLIVLPTSYATAKGEETAVIICKYLTIKLEPDDMKQFEIFALQSQKYAINFSACGIVNLHRSSITTIIGTALTYLVILIQFQNSD
ncbi:gustatory receptor for sugar taste 43a-like [Sipha flava]|uniref:Gustatory receptor n=1 Tax=Sipha flava TaxID=143950 RepID=A0A2S2QAD2_9HEMI|nr:gustatory receptor for sugar taste 43a-like [Sipha flava]